MTAKRGINAMVKLLLDTTVLIDCLRARNNRPTLLKQLCLERNILGCCAINVAEIWTGAKAKERSVTEELLDSLEYYAITRQAAKLAGELKQKYSPEGITLSLVNTLIAAVAITQKLTLITDNPKHFPMPELSLYT